MVDRQRPRSLVPGTAAGIMHLMLPGLGAGVTDHSNFFDDPRDRINRSKDQLFFEPAASSR